MLFSTCLCLKKNASQRIYYSNQIISKRLTSFTTTITKSRDYCNISTCTSLHHPFTITRSRLLKYPSKNYNNPYFYDNNNKYLSTKSIILSAYKKEQDLPSDTTTTFIEKLNYPSLHPQQIQEQQQQKESHLISSSPSSSSLPNKTNDIDIHHHHSTIDSTYNNTSSFDSTALKSCLEKNQIDNALSLILNSKISSSLPTNDNITLDYPLEDRILFFNTLSKLSSIQLMTLLQPWIEQDHHQDQSSLINRKRFSTFLKTLCTTLPKDSLLFLLYQFSAYEHVQLILFQQFVNHYIDDIKMSKEEQSNRQYQYQSLDDLLDYITKINKNVDFSSGLKVRLFNMTLNGCIKAKKQDHIIKVLNQMEMLNLKLDHITFNILIRSQLDKNNLKAAIDLYENMEKKYAITPTVSTFNTFIKYACKHQLWNDLTKWIQQMADHHHVQPNPITLRIMMDTLTNHANEVQVIDAFKRVADQVPISNQDLEWTINISITHLLRNKYIDSALEVLYQLFEQRSKMATQSYSLSAYSYNLLMHAFTLKGDMDAAENVLLNMKKGQIYHYHQELSSTSSKINENESTATKLITIPSPDIVSYTTLIHGYIRSASSHDINMNRVTDLYSELIDRGLEENRSLLSVILFGLIKSGFYESKESMKLFKKLIDDDNEHLVNKNNTMKQQKDIDFSKVILYNMMMDGYFMKQHHRNQAKLLSNHHKKIKNNHNQHIDSHIPKKSIELLQEAMEKGLPLDTSTLNIWVRGLSLFNHDLNMAESMVHWMTRQYHININERTVYYLVKAAIKQGRKDKARKWIKTYENNGKTIQGNGLLNLKCMVMGE